jgi:hypothetical protein
LQLYDRASASNASLRLQILTQRTSFAHGGFTFDRNKFPFNNLKRLQQFHRNDLNFLQRGEESVDPKINQPAGVEFSGRMFNREVIFFISPMITNYVDIKRSYCECDNDICA